jgi:biotin carboxylase
VPEGHVSVHGVFDMPKDERGLQWSRLVYPAQVPEQVQRRMVDVSERLLRHVGYDDGCFNMEFFWDRRRDRIWLLEINPRLSQSHCELFEKVDGASNAQVMLDVALGHSPDPPRWRGEAAVAAKFFIRAFRDGIVTRAPTPDDVARAEAAVPGAHVSVHVEPGVLLSDLPDQDSYSYELATVRLGAANERELLQRHRKVTAELPFAVEVSDR